MSAMCDASAPGESKVLTFSSPTFSEIHFGFRCLCISTELKPAGTRSPITALAADRICAPNRRQVESTTFSTGFPNTVSNSCSKFLIPASSAPRKP